MNALRRWPWLLILAVITLLLGLAGFSLLPPGDLPSPEDRLIRTLKFFKADGTIPAGSPVILRVARLTGALFTAFALVKFWRSFFHEQIAAFHLSWWHGHVVICGLGRKGLHLLECFRGQGRRVVAAQIRPSDEEAAGWRRRGAIVVAGDATHVDTLGKLRLEHAAEVFAVCGDDRTNFEIALQVLERYRAAGCTQSLTCFVHLVDVPLLHRLQHRDFFSERPAGLEFVFFNVHEHAARRLQAQHPLPVPRSSDDAPVHLLLLGSGPALRALLLHHARTAHLGDLRRPRITVLSPGAGAEAAALRSAYPALPEICDLSWQELQSDGVAVRLLDAVRSGTDQIRAVVALSNDQDSLALALLLREAGLDPGVPLFVRIGEQAGLVRLLRAANREVSALNLVAFGAVEDVCGAEVLAQRQLDHLAEASHEAYRQSQLKSGVTPKGNPSLLPWKELPEDLKAANRVLADHLEIKRRTLAALGTHPAAGTPAPDHLELLAQMEHNRWCAERRLAGWTFAAMRDNQRRLHPSLVPWDQLTERERQKDREAVRAALNL